MIRKIGSALVLAISIFTTMPTQAQLTSALGDEFIGRWQNDNISADNFSISKADDVFVVTTTNGRILEGKLNNGQLFVNTADRQTVVSYLKATDSLTFAGQVFSRVK